MTPENIQALAKALGELGTQERGGVALSLPAPPFFDSSKPHSWPKWLTHFDRFRGGTGLSQRGDKEQTDTFLYLFGPDGDEMYRALRIEEGATFEVVRKTFDDFFVPLCTPRSFRPLMPTLSYIEATRPHDATLLFLL